MVFAPLSTFLRECLKSHQNFLEQTRTKKMSCQHKICHEAKASEMSVGISGAMCVINNLSMATTATC